MNNNERILKEIRAALEQDRLIDLHHNPIQLTVRDGTVVLTGEVTGVAAKKLAKAYALALLGNEHVEDRLLVRPGESLEDADLCDLVFRALDGEPAFNDLPLRAWVGGTEKARRRTARETTEIISVEVESGVVTLNGRVESYAHMALGEVLAWWRRGTRNVVNNLALNHPPEDIDGEMTDVLRMVLEKDRFVTEGQVKGICRNFTATITGAVKNETEKHLAEIDAWYLPGVSDVVNRLAVM